MHTTAVKGKLTSTCRSAVKLSTQTHCHLITRDYMEAEVAASAEVADMLIVIDFIDRRCYEALRGLTSLCSEPFCRMHI